MGKGLRLHYRCAALKRLGDRFTVFFSVSTKVLEGKTFAKVSLDKGIWKIILWFYFNLLYIVAISDNTFLQGTFSNSHGRLWDPFHFQRVLG